MLSTPPVGCAHIAVRPPLVRVLSVDLPARALMSFDQAIYYKPREGPMAGVKGELAPLLVQNAPEETAKSAHIRFGAVEPGPNGTIQVDPARPVIYVDTTRVTLAGLEYEQLVYLWCYAPDAESRSPFPVIAQGIRITLDASGFPLIWEVLRNDTPKDAVFVSALLEEAAGRAFGPPLPDRRFSVERSLSETPYTVVARVLDDGPVPMGPYVYLTFPAGGRGRTPYAVSTVLCRCMASQVEQFVDTVYYDLQPMDHLPDWTGCDVENWRWWGPTYQRLRCFQTNGHIGCARVPRGDLDARLRLAVPEK